MFPTAYSTIVTNDAGETLGWDLIYPDDEPYYDDAADLYDDYRDSADYEPDPETCGHEDWSSTMGKTYCDLCGTQALRLEDSHQYYDDGSKIMIPVWP